MKTFPMLMQTLAAFCALGLIESPACPAPPLERWTREAVAPEADVAKTAVAHLRAAGQPGLDALLAAHPALVDELNAGGRSEPAARLRTALEAVGAQRDCHASRLFWFTDFAEAQKAARETGRPILSLRLLGQLDEEFSCANSRFFRTTLYANADIAECLRANYILHWKSVRPVPKLTIDFGDGRVVERTITGNSIHYVLAADGTVIDALPGLHGPRAFLQRVQRGALVARSAARFDGATRVKFLSEYHSERRKALASQWAADLRTIGAGVSRVANVQLAVQPAPSAIQAAPRAASKAVAEVPILRASMPRQRVIDATAQSATDAQWARIAELHAADARIDGGALALLRVKTATAQTAGALAEAKRKVEDPLLRTVRNLERSIAEDTVRNEYLFHAQLHDWLAAAPARDVDALNARVYAELFLTPDSDPWLGLVPADTFTALDNDGRTRR